MHEYYQGFDLRDSGGVYWLVILYDQKWVMQIHIFVNI